MRFLLFLVISASALQAEQLETNSGRIETPPPETVDWGIAPEKKAQEILDRLLAVAGKSRFGPIQFQYLPNGAPDHSVQVAASALPYRGLDENNKYPMVYATYRTFELCHNEDELAFGLAHEIAHIILEHELADDKFFRKTRKQFNAWRKKNKKKLAAMKKQYKSVMEYESAIEEAFNQDIVNPFLSNEEREADLNGLNLMRLAGFNAEAAKNVMVHNSQYCWAMNERVSVQECWGWDPSSYHADRTRYEYLDEFLAAEERINQSR